MSVAEQRYQAVPAVVGDAETVTDVAARFGVRRQTVHDWLARYEAGGLEGLGGPGASDSGVYRYAEPPNGVEATSSLRLVGLR
jgi:transposase-like protein